MGLSCMIGGKEEVDIYALSNVEGDVRIVIELS